MPNGIASPLLVPADLVARGEALPVDEPLNHYRLSVGQYHGMRDAGILPEDAPVELVEGLLVESMVRRPPHDTALGLIQDALARNLPEGCILRVQSAVTLADGEPEPDLAVVRGSRRDFVQRHPGPEECLLVVEIAETSLTLDLGAKLRSYARGSVPEYWVINLVDSRIEAFAEPSGAKGRPKYRSHRVLEPGDAVALPWLSSEVPRLSVDELLP